MRLRALRSSCTLQTGRAATGSSHAVTLHSVAFMSPLSTYVEPDAVRSVCASTRSLIAVECHGLMVWRVEGEEVVGGSPCTRGAEQASGGHGAGAGLESRDRPAARLLGPLALPLQEGGHPA